MYFLVDNLTVTSNQNSDYYTEFPIVSIKKPFIEVVNDMLMKEVPNLIKQMFQLNTIESIKAVLYRLPPEVSELILIPNYFRKNNRVLCCVILTTF